MFRKTNAGYCQTDINTQHTIGAKINLLELNQVAAIYIYIPQGHGLVGRKYVTDKSIYIYML